MEPGIDVIYLLQMSKLLVKCNKRVIINTKYLWVAKEGELPMYSAQTLNPQDASVSYLSYLCLLHFVLPAVQCCLGRTSPSLTPLKVTLSYIRNQGPFNCCFTVCEHVFYGKHYTNKTRLKFSVVSVILLLFDRFYLQEKKIHTHFQLSKIRHGIPGVEKVLGV